jgi:hypothetical protein
MSRSRQFALVLIVATAIASAGSHWVASWLKIKTIAAQAFVIGKPNGGASAFMAGSSLSGYGSLWGLVSTQLNGEIKAWGIAGGSPVEFEQFQKRVPEARTTFIVVSTYDLDESLICDFRADIVPMSQAVKSLKEIHADWRYSKRALSQYPLTWLRKLFPTLGRSRGIMGRLRENIASLIKPASHASATMAGPTIKFGKETAEDEYARQKLSDWSESKIIGKLVAMQVDFQGAHSFNGPKRLAFERMLQFAAQRGRTIVVVMPLAPAYSKEFILPETDLKFETALAEVKHRVPEAEWLRLDQLPGLAANENFCDLVHLNTSGKQTATEALQARLKQPAHQP